MPHGKSLRAIGQSLESLGVIAFVLEKNGRSYIVRSDSLPDVSRVELKQSLSEKVWEAGGGTRRRRTALAKDGALRYDGPYIAWLDAQGRRKRRRRFSVQATGTVKVSQLLRTLGKHLERLEPHAFSIHWTNDSAVVDYELPNGETVREVLSSDKLRELTVRSRVRRSRRR